MRRIFLFILLFSAIMASVAATWHSANRLEPVVTVPELMNMQEYFRFEVRYGFMRLGETEVYIVKDTLFRGYEAKLVKAVIRSNPSLPLVGYKEVHYYSILAWNEREPYGLRFWTNNLHKGVDESTLYDFDYDNGWVFTFENGEPVDTLELVQPADSGPALFYFSRPFSGTNEIVQYPIYVEHEKGMVTIRNFDRVERMQSPAFDNRNIDVYYSEGDADLQGPFGFKGQYKAWHKTGSMRIPIEAHVSVWLGNVRIRLVEYREAM
jgi:hypothetical protein